MKISKILIIIGLIIAIIVCSSLAFYGYGMGRISKTSEKVNFIVKSGTSKIDIVKNLKNANLIRSEYILLAYLYFNNEIKLQAGTYELDRNMTPKEMIDKISKGDVLISTLSIKFLEGKNMTDFIDLINDKLKIEKEEIIKTLNDKEFLNNLIEKYDFLTNVVLSDNIYYALEGYLFPDTYEVKEDISLKELIIKMLDNTKNKLSTLTFNDKYSVHEILTLASIIELEASKEEDRPVVSQVFYNRLAKNMNLGSDITTYYAAKKKLGEKLTEEDLELINPYNTRKLSAGKLPIGPVCNPSLSSIKAAINPSGNNNYLYFVANTCTKEVFYFENLLDHSKKARELRSICETN